MIINIKVKVAISLYPLLLACAGDNNMTPDQAVAPETMVTPSDSINPLSGSPIPSASTVFGEGEVHTYHLLLVNTREVEAHVFAQAGAARVLLDTVPALDSVRLDIRLRATRVNLEAEDAIGRLLYSDLLELQIESANRWVISP
tara:strand:+ start:1110 stop:1541 length:432 start_codon:yes stop_codon:yes gene_type:complete